MDLSTSAVIKLLGPKIPMILKTVAWHSLGFSKTSTKWDLKTELVIHVLRSIIDSPYQRPISVQQKASILIRDQVVKGRMWISRVKVYAPPEDDIRQALFETIEQMQTGDEVYTKPEFQTVEAEWTGYRPNVDKDSPELSLPEEERYKKLMHDVHSNVTILYFHGGGYYLLDPASHRPVVTRLAKLTGGRALSIRYRLAPQNPFPAPLLDALLSYLYLLYPPPGSFHEPVSPSNIVFTGDSAGGNLSLVLLQLILHLHRTIPNGQTPTLKFHGKDVAIPIPAGIATISPWLDITHSLPSLEKNAKYDYLPRPMPTFVTASPPCDIWPSNPPRADMYCDGSALMHPLVSPLAAMHWKMAPPVFIGCGEEMLADEDAVFAKRLVKQGVKVVWEQYEAMPHCFAMLFPGHPGGRMFFAELAKFIKMVAEKPSEVNAQGHWVTARKLQRVEVDVAALTKLEDEEVLAMMKLAQDRRIKRFARDGMALAKL